MSGCCSEFAWGTAVPFAVCFLFSGVVSHHKNQKPLKMCLREEKDVGGKAGEVAGGGKSDRYHGLTHWGVCG